MTHTELAIVVLAAGKGTRMKSKLHKVLHTLGGRPMLHHLMDTADLLNPSRNVIVVGAGKEQVENSVGDKAEVVVQEPQLGTGHAVQVTKDALAGFKGRVLILYGDVPMVSQNTMEDMVSNDADVVVLGFKPNDAKAYGRLKVSSDGNLDAIIEFKDANEDERAIDLCNSGIMALNGESMFDLLDALSNDNAAGEYYLTDVVEIANSKGLKCAVTMTSEQEVTGINSRSELASAEKMYQQTRRQYFMDEGVTLIDPETTTTMDKYLTACTGIDALVHAIEAYVSAASSPIFDLHALEAIRLIQDNLLVAIEDPLDIEIRKNMMLGSLEAGLAFSNASLGVVHAMSHSLGGFLDLPHGECNSILLNHVIACWAEIV